MDIVVLGILLWTMESIPLEMGIYAMLELKFLLWDFGSKLYDYDGILEILVRHWKLVLMIWEFWITSLNSSLASFETKDDDFGNFV